ncbi:hypothetical protein D3C81_919140 [compost metagenome]
MQFVIRVRGRRFAARFIDTPGQRLQFLGKSNDIRPLLQRVIGIRQMKQPVELKILRKPVAVRLEPGRGPQIRFRVVPQVHPE